MTILNVVHLYCGPWEYNHGIIGDQIKLEVKITTFTKQNIIDYAKYVNSYY